MKMKRRSPRKEEWGEKDGNKKQIIFGEIRRVHRRTQAENKGKNYLADYREKVK